MKPRNTTEPQICTQVPQSLADIGQIRTFADWEFDSSDCTSDVNHEPGNRMDHPRNSTGVDYGAVLVADDQVAIRNLLKFYFRDKFRVLGAKNGAEAIQIAIEHKPFAALLDVMMDHELDGIHALTQIKANPMTKGISVAMITGKSQSDDQMLARTAGADAYFVKPFSLEKIQLWIEKLRAASNPGGAP